MNAVAPSMLLASLRFSAPLIVAVWMLGGCATQPNAPATTPSRVEIDDQVGFTITEDAEVDVEVNSDYEQAISDLEMGRHEQGIAKLESVAADTPGLSAPRIDLGIAYHRVGDLEAAERNLLLALETNPEHPIAHNELGIIYRKTGRFTQARQSYEAALDIYPGFHFARRNLAVLCDIYLADLDCALTNYQAYMKTVPDDDEATMWIADIENRLGR
jgi:tetratricopeptide (TPR) repeat protein